MKDDTEIAMYCVECKEVYGIKFKHRHRAICLGCLNDENVLMKLRAFSFTTREAATIAADEYLTYQTYLEVQP